MQYFTEKSSCDADGTAFRHGTAQLRTPKRHNGTQNRKKSKYYFQ